MRLLFEAGTQSAVILHEPAEIYDSTVTSTTGRLHINRRVPTLLPISCPIDVKLILLLRVSTMLSYETCLRILSQRDEWNQRLVAPEYEQLPYIDIEGKMEPEYYKSIPNRQR